MPWMVKTFMYVEADEPIIHDDQMDAEQEADQIMFMQPGEVIAIVVECDEDGIPEK